MPNNRIDAISVGLGIDAASLTKDIKNRVDGFTITPRLVRPSFESLMTFTKSVNAVVSAPGNANRLGIKLQVGFDDAQAKKALGDIVDTLNSSGLSVKIPIEYVYPEGGGGQGPAGGAPPSPAGGGGPSTGPTRGGGGGRRGGAPAAAPAGAAVTAGAVAAVGVANAAPPASVRTAAQANTEVASARPARGARAAGASNVTAGAVAATAVASSAPAPPPAATPPPVAAPLTMEQAIQQGIQTAMAPLMPQILAAVQPPPAPAVQPPNRRRGPQPDTRSDWQRLWTPRQRTIASAPPKVRAAVKQMRAMVRSGQVKPEGWQAAVRLAQQGKPLPEHLAEYEPFYTHTQYIQEHGAEVRAARAASAPGTIRQGFSPTGELLPVQQRPEVVAQTEGLNKAMSSGDWGALDVQYPGNQGTSGLGVGALMSQGRSEEAQALYFASRYPNTPRYEKKRETEPWLPVSRAQHVLGQRRGMFRKKIDVLAQRYPLDFAMLSWTGMGNRWDPEKAEWTSGYQPQIMGGVAGSSPPAKKPSRRRMFELLRDPTSARIELAGLEAQRKSGLIGPEDETRATQLSKEISRFEAQKKKLGTPTGTQTPFPTSAGRVAGPVLERMRELASMDYPMGTPQAHAERAGLQHESDIYREWLAKNHPELLKQFVAANETFGDKNKAWAAKFAQLPLGQELPPDAAQNTIMSGKPHASAAETIKRMDEAAEVQRQLAAQRAQKLGIKGVLGLQGGGVRIFPGLISSLGSPFGSMVDKRGDLNLLRHDRWIPEQALGMQTDDPERLQRELAAFKNQARHMQVGRSGGPDTLLYDDRLKEMLGKSGLDVDRIEGQTGFLGPYQQLTAWGARRGPRLFKGSLSLYDRRGGLDWTRGENGELIDIFPSVPSPFRRRGIGSALYEYGEKLGLGVEAISDENAQGSQTDMGSGLWRSRKRKLGWTDEQILEKLRPDLVDAYYDPQRQVGVTSRYNRWLGDLARERGGNSSLVEGDADDELLFKGKQGGGFRDRFSQWRQRRGRQGRLNQWRQRQQASSALEGMFGPEMPVPAWSYEGSPEHRHLVEELNLGEIGMVAENWPLAAYGGWDNVPEHPVFAAGRVPSFKSMGFEEGLVRADTGEVGGIASSLPADERDRDKVWPKHLFTEFRNNAMGGFLGHRQGGGPKEIRTLSALERFIAANPDSYSRWTPDIEADMRPGARSAGLADRTVIEKGISVSPVGENAFAASSSFAKARQEWLGTPIELELDVGPARGDWSYRGGRRKGYPGFKPRSLYLLSGQPVGEGWDGEPVLDPESIEPLAKVRRRALDEMWRKSRGMATGGLMDRLRQAQIQTLMNQGRVEESQSLQKQLEQSRGGWDQPALPMSPFAQALREKRLPPKDMTGMRSGGHRPSSLSDLPGVAADVAGITAVGEQGEEWIVRQHDGSEFVVPNHQLPHFRKMVGMAAGGEWEGTVPEGMYDPRPRVNSQFQGWSSPYQSPRAATPLELLRTGLVSTAAGQRFVGPGKPGWPGPSTRQLRGPSTIGEPGAGRRIRMDAVARSSYSDLRTNYPLDMQMMDATPTYNRPPGLEGLQMLGSGSGSLENRRVRANLAAIGEGKASSTSIMSTGIQRVFVTNWPTGFGTSRSGPTSIQGGAPPPTAGPQPAPQAMSPGQSLGARPPAPPTPPPLPQTPSGYVAGEVPSTRTVPISRAVSKIEARRSVEDLRERLDTAGIEASEALQKSPVRALSVAMGQIAQTVIGGRSGILSREKMARGDIRTAAQTTGMFERAVGETQAVSLKLGRFATEAEAAGMPLGFREQTYQNPNTGMSWKYGTVDPQALADFMTKAPEEWKDALGGLLSQQREQMKEATYLEPIAEQQVSVAEASAKKILTGPQQLKSQMVGLGGIVGGTLLFTTAMQAGQLAMQAITEAANPVVDAMTGFSTTLRDTTASLAQAFHQAGGAPAGIAGALGQTGIGASQAGGLMASVGELAMRQAGNENLRQQIALVRAMRSAGDIGTAGLTKPTGGLLGTEFFATPSTVQQIAGELPGAEATGGAFPFQKEIEKALAVPVAMLSEAPGMAEIMNVDKSGFFGQSTLRAIEGLFTTSIKNGLAGGVLGLPGMDLNGMDAAAVDRRLELFNTNITDKGFKASGTLRAGEKTGGGVIWEEAQLTPQDAEQVQLLQDALAELDVDPRVMESFKQANVMFETLTAGNLAGNVEKITEYLSAVNEAARRPTRELALAEMAPQLEAEQRNMVRERIFKEQELIPASVAQQYMAAPMPGMIGMPTTTGIISGMAGVGERALAAPYASGISRVINQLKPIQAQGREALLDLGVTDQQITQVERLGTSIAKLRANAGQIQLDLEMRQYNEQLYLAERSMGDILGILGKTGSATSELGRLQRSQILDSRELSRIQLARSQRELNLQLALSKLRAPGETAEERAVRQREAQIQVRMQQRELSLNKGMTERGFNIEDIGYQRQARDLGVQIALMKEAREVTIQVRGMNTLAEAKEGLLAVKTEYMNTARDAGIELRRLGFRVQQEIETRAGKFNQLFATEVGKTMDTLLTGYTKLMNKYQTAITGHTPEGNVNEGMGENWQSTVPEETRKQKAEKTGAAGGIWDVSSPTRFLAGEAGNEEIVILRNPRSGVTAPSTSMRSMGGGGGGVSINLVLNATVRGEADETRLAHKVAKTLHREAAILVGA